MGWKELKAHLLEAGSVRVRGKPLDEYTEHSSAGPGAGGSGSVFFSIGEHRVRLGIDPESPVTLTHKGRGEAVIRMSGTDYRGILEPVALHCPRQAYITISEGCIFGCRYCTVPAQPAHVKTSEEVAALIEKVRNRIDAISITSGVIGSAEEDEARVIEIVSRLKGSIIPIGVSIYPTPGTPSRLHALGVSEVKFNIEAATPDLFKEMCPGLDRGAILKALEESVALFGRNRVYSNVILGLGETDEEMELCLRKLTRIGVIPVVRPLSPAGALSRFSRPSAERILKISSVHERCLKEAGLDPSAAMTMCSLCTGCDLVPGRDT